MQDDDKRLRLVLEATSDGLFEWNMNTGEAYFSPHYFSMLGYKEGELPSNYDTWVSLLHPDDKEQIYKVISEYKEGKRDKHELEYRMKAKSGDWIWVLSRGASIDKDSKGIPIQIIGTHIDITSRKKAEELVRENEEKYRVLSDDSVLGLVIYKSNPVRVAYVNKAMEKILGYSIKEMLNFSQEDIKKITHPDDSAVVWRRFAERLAGKDVPSRYEVRVIRKDGKTGCVEINAKKIMISGEGAIMVTYMDVTNRKKAEEALLKNEAIMNSIIESLPFGLYTLNKDLVYTRQNSISRKYWGNIIEKRPEDIAPNPEVLTLWKSNNRRALSGETVHEEVKIEDNNGSTFHFLNITAPINSGKAITGILGINIDISKRINAEREQKKLKEQLLKTEKMQAIGQLAGGIAHDFNNQLAGIQCFIELIRDAVHDNSELVSFSDSILSIVKHSAELTRQLLVFSRKGKFRILPVNMHDVIHEVVSILKHSIDKRIRITQDLVADPCITPGDPSQLQNAILNVALNSRDAMEDGGELSFHTKNEYVSEKKIKDLGLEIEPGNYISLIIKDTGTGIDEKIKDKIFEPFFTTKGPGKGTGMGLAAVYGTVKSHSGAIHVQSESGAGTTITCYFLVSKETTAIKEDREKALIPETQKRSILIVEDEEKLSVSMKLILSKNGYDVSVCNNGKSAIDFYRKSWKQIDLVVLDMIMPEMNGKETYFEMKKVNSDVKVILVSGYSKNKEISEVIEMGVMGFLQKPFPMNALLNKIAGILNKL